MPLQACLHCVMHYAVTVASLSSTVRWQMDHWQHRCTYLNSVDIPWMILTYCTLMRLRQAKLRISTPFGPYQRVMCVTIRKIRTFACSIPPIKMIFSCRKLQTHNCEDVQLYSFIYYTHIFRSLLWLLSGCRSVRIQEVCCWLRKLHEKRFSRCVSTDVSDYPIVKYHKIL